MHCLEAMPVVMGFNPGAGVLCIPYIVVKAGAYSGMPCTDTIGRYRGPFPP